MRKILLSGIIAALILFQAISAMADVTQTWIDCYNESSDKNLFVVLEGLENYDCSESPITVGPGQCSTLSIDLTAWFLSTTTYRLGITLYFGDETGTAEDAEKVAYIEIVCQNMYTLYPEIKDFYIDKMKVYSGSVNADYNVYHNSWGQDRAEMLIYAKP